ncbi:hypothetical protein JF50_04875 [Pseudoalteromonas luteoviolacea]|uniref:Fibronectin type-III domain-containing protein n=1 Tax=Pseudoalteromonas luteoviolacea TaxID=43657 RepID=A0A0C1MTG4_9GAMM|nr:fibronectin type III domain-containing protein [Pseudoalteromonas luteoviolacea]KID58073.1 hypothetical protein JF50_04875 [Pseudoalteromonas luteoviolacea]
MKHKLNGLVLLVGGILSPELLAYCAKESYVDTGVPLWSTDCHLAGANGTTLNKYYPKGADITYSWTVGDLPKSKSKKIAGITYNYSYWGSTFFQVVMTKPDGTTERLGESVKHAGNSVTYKANTPGTYKFCMERQGKVGWLSSSEPNANIPEKTITSNCHTTHVIGGGVGSLSTQKTYKSNVNVNWRTAGNTIDFVGATDIKVQKKRGDGAWEDAGSSSITSGSHTISLTSAGDYSFQLKGCRTTNNMESCSPYSTVSDTVTYLAPSTPSDISATGLLNGILPVGNTRLEWSTVSAQSGAVGFDVYYQLYGSDKKYSGNKLDVGGLQNNEDYSYKVRACNKDGLCSGYSSAVEFTVELPPGTVSMGLQDKEFLVPINSSGTLFFIPVVTGYPVHNGVAVVTDNSITLEWNSAGTGATYQFVMIKDGVEHPIQAVTGTTKTVSLTQDGDYTFKVRACFTACGDWQSVNIITKVEKPSKPQTPAISAPATAFKPFKVTWPKDDSVAGYRLSINNKPVRIDCSEELSECSWSSDESLPLGEHWFRLYAYNEKNGQTVSSNMAAVRVSNRRDETYLLRKRLYWEEADQQENPDAGLYNRELAAFRYQTKLFKQKGKSTEIVNSAINGHETASFTTLWGSAERARADDVKAELENMKRLPQFLDDDIVHLLWLDVIHDSAEADLILSNQYLDNARGANLTFQEPKYIERELANAENAIDTAFTRYRSLLAGSGSDYAQKLLTYSADRGKRSPRYWDGDLAKPVYSEGEIRAVKRRLANGDLTTASETILFGGYKDVVMVYNVMAQKLDTFYRHTHTNMVSGKYEEAYYADYIHTLNILRSDVQVIDNALKELFGSAIMQGSDIDELPIAYAKFVSANTRLDNLLSWLKGETNLMGHPFGAFPVLHNHNKVWTFDYLADGLASELVAKAEAAYAKAHASYDTFHHNLSTIATVHEDKFDQYNYQLKQLIGWELRTQSCIIDQDRCFVENTPTDGSQLAWQQQNIDTARLNLERALLQLRQRVGYCQLTNGANAQVTYDSPQDEILDEQVCADIAAQKSAEDNVPYTHVFGKGSIHIELERILAQKDHIHDVSDIFLFYGEERANIQIQLAKVRAEAERSRHKVAVFDAIADMGTSLFTATLNPVADLGKAQGYGAAIGGITGVVGEMVSHRAAMRKIKKEGELLAQSERLGAEERVEINNLQLTLLDAEQARRIESLWLEMKSLELSVAQAELSLEQETERFIGTYRQAAWLISQMQQSQNRLAGRYAADPIHAKRLSKAMLEMEETFESAQEWVFYTALAYNNKWNRSVAAETSGTASTTRPQYTQREIQVIRAQHASDLSKALADLKKADGGDDNKPLVAIPSIYSMRKHGFGYGELRDDVVDSTPGIDCAPCTSDEAFLRRLTQSVIHVGPAPARGQLSEQQEAVFADLDITDPLLTAPVEGEQTNQTPTTQSLRIGFSTVKEFETAFNKPEYVYSPLPPGFEWYNCPKDGGNHLNKIHGVSVNVITGDANVPGKLNYTLSMGGQSVRRTPTLGNYVNENGLFVIQNEFEYLPIHGWGVSSNGKLQVESNRIMGQSQATIDAQPGEEKLWLNTFNEQNVAATNWILTLDLADSGLKISNIYDIELEFMHTHQLRTFNSLCSDLRPARASIEEVVGKLMHRSELGNAPKDGIWIETNKGPYQVNSNEL